MLKTKVVFLFLIITFSGCTPKLQQQKYITIGALLPLTGEDSDAGLRAFNGLQLAKEEINESGGLLGKKLDVVVLNDRGDEEYIVQQYKALLKRGVAAIIGSSYSDPTMALARASETDGIPVISPTASNPEVTIGRRNVFRAIFTDDYQAEVMAHFAYNSLGVQTALVLSNESIGSYKRTAEAFAESFKSWGGLVIAFEKYLGGDNFTDILGKYSANPPDIIFCPENYVPAAKLVNAAFQTGFNNTYILGTDAWDGILVYVHHKDALKNVYYSAPFSFDDHDKDVTLFVNNYFGTFSQMPLSDSATAYTCIYILSEAIKKTGTTNWDDIITSIKTNEFNLITGRIKFDENNNPRTNAYVIQVEGGVYSTFEKISLQRGQ